MNWRDRHLLCSDGGRYPDQDYTRWTVQPGYRRGSCLSQTAPLIVQFNSGEQLTFNEQFLTRHLPNLSRRRQRKGMHGWIIRPMELIECSYSELPIHTTVMKQLFTYLQRCWEYGVSTHDILDDYEGLFVREHGSDLTMQDMIDAIRICCHFLSHDRGFGCSVLVWRSLSRCITSNTQLASQEQDLDTIYQLMQGLASAGSDDWSYEVLHDFTKMMTPEDIEDFRGDAQYYRNLGDPWSGKLLRDLFDIQERRAAMNLPFGLPGDGDPFGMPGYRARRAGIRR